MKIESKSECKSESKSESKSVAKSMKTPPPKKRKKEEQGDVDGDEASGSKKPKVESGFPDFVEQKESLEVYTRADAEKDIDAKKKEKEKGKCTIENEDEDDALCAFIEELVEIQRNIFPPDATTVVDVIS